MNCKQTFGRHEAARFAALLLALAACRPDVEDDVPCHRSGSCPTGYACAVDGTCAPEAAVFCDLPCEEWFQCRRDAEGAPACVVEEGFVFSLLADEPRVSRDGVIELVCRTDAPLIRSGRMTATSREGVQERPVTFENGVGVGAFTVWGSRDYDLQCTIVYGPESWPIQLVSPIVRISVD